jgi:hypothetical protein
MSGFQRGLQVGGHIGILKGRRTMQNDEDILKKMAEMGPNYAVDYGEDPKNWVMSREDFEHRQAGSNFDNLA